MGNAGNNLVVVVIVVVIVVVTDIEEAITFQPERLVNLKIETDGFHIGCNLLFLQNKDIHYRCMTLW